MLACGGEPAGKEAESDVRATCIMSAQCWVSVEVGAAQTAVIGDRCDREGVRKGGSRSRSRSRAQQALALFVAASLLRRATWAWIVGVGVGVGGRGE